MIDGFVARYFEKKSKTEETAAYIRWWLQIIIHPSVFIIPSIIPSRSDT